MVLQRGLTWLEVAMYYGIGWLDDHSDVVYLVGLGLVLCGIALGIRHIWRRYFQEGFRKLYNRFVRNPVSWFLKPFKRMHRRWSEKNSGFKMAKWKKGHLADVFTNVLLEEAEKGRISRQEFKRLTNELGKFFNLPDMMRKKHHREAVKQRILSNEEFKAGPANEIPGPKPGEEVVPQYQGLGHGYLARKKSA